MCLYIYIINIHRTHTYIMQKLLFCMPLIMIHLLTAIININQPTFYNPIKFQWVKSSPILFCTKYSNAAECVVNSVSAFNGCRNTVRSTVTESNEERGRRAYVRMQYFYFSEQSKHTDTQKKSLSFSSSTPFHREIWIRWWWEASGRGIRW